MQGHVTTSPSTLGGFGTSGHNRIKPKIGYFVFIFVWYYFNTYVKIKNTFLFPLFALNKIAFTDFQYDVSFLKNHHQLCFFKYGPVFLLLIPFYVPNSIMYYTFPKKGVLVTSQETIRLSLSYTCDFYGKYLKSSS